MTKQYRSTLVDILVNVLHMTPEAVKVSLPGSPDSIVWVPRNLCEVYDKDPETNLGTLTLSRSLARLKRLL